MRMIAWTTLVERVRTWWPWSAPVALRATSVLAIEQTIPPVPREYHALYAYLEHRYASVVVLTFDQIEALLGGALPTAARSEGEWWTDVAATQRHCVAWTGAGRTAAPNFCAGIITFERAV